MPLQSEFVKRLQAARASFLEVVVVTILLAFSVAVLATVAFEELGNIASLSLGLALATACFCYIVARNSSVSYSLRHLRAVPLSRGRMNRNSWQSSG